MSNKSLRYLCFFIGVLINSFGVALITKAALGTSPISSVPYVLSLRFAPTLGGFTFVMNLLGWFNPQGLPVQLAALALGCAVLGFGISVEVAPDVLRVPGEGLVGALSTVTGVRFGSVKVAFDVTLVAIALALSFVFFRGLNGLGLGTVVSALIVGRFVNLFNSRLPLIARIASLAKTPSAAQMPEQQMPSGQQAG